MPKTVFHAAVGLFYAQQPSLNYPGSGNSIGFQWNTVTYNAPVTLTAPPASQVIDGSKLGL